MYMFKKILPAVYQLPLPKKRNYAILNRAMRCSIQV